MLQLSSIVIAYSFVFIYSVLLNEHSQCSFIQCIFQLAISYKDIHLFF